MLILTLRKDDPIQVGDATIQLLKSSGSKLRIGIEAPKSVPIVRRKARITRKAPLHQIN
jgi:sRNA-binding carbon storage regulator CsrA